LLEWANSWNRHGVPVRVHLTSAELFISTDLMLTPLLPVSDAHVLYAYATVTRSWKAVIDSLQQAGLLELG
jgi:hypothetical protein